MCKDTVDGIMLEIEEERSSSNSANRVKAYQLATEEACKEGGSNREIRRRREALLGEALGHVMQECKLVEVCAQASRRMRQAMQLHEAAEERKGERMHLFMFAELL
jgi:hypothetical protein